MLAVINATEARKKKKKNATEARKKKQSWEIEE